MNAFDNDPDVVKLRKIEIVIAETQAQIEDLRLSLTTLQKTSDALWDKIRAKIYGENGLPERKV